DVLVLGGGGILGEAWMTAVLVGLQDATDFDARECDGFVGTSAGSIVAAVLAAGIEPSSRLGKLPEQPAVEDGQPTGSRGAAPRAVRMALQAGRGAAAPFAAAGLRTTAPGRAPFRRTPLGVAPTGSLRGGRAGALGIVSRSAATVEALALERRGARVKVVTPDAAWVQSFGGNLIIPRPRAQVVAAGLAQGRAVAY